MNVEILKEGITFGLKNILGAVETKNTIPILSKVLFRARKDQGLVIETTNMNMSMRFDLGCNCNEDLSACIDAYDLYKLVKNFPDESMVSLDFNDDYLDISFCDTKYRLVVVPDSDFPKLFTDKIQYQFVDALKIKQMADLISLSISDNDVRLFLTGAGFDKNNGGIEVTSSNGKQLSNVFLDIDNNFIQKPCILPRKFLLELAKNIENNNIQSIGVFFNEDKAYFKMNDIEYLSRFIESQYPKLNVMLKQSMDCVFSLVGEDLRSALLRMSMLSSDFSDKITIGLKDDKLLLFAQDETKGSGNELIDVVKERGSMANSFNLSLGCLINILGVFKKNGFKDITIKVCDKPEFPIIINTKDFDGFDYAIMPII